jgi:hypothetical protein
MKKVLSLLMMFVFLNATLLAFPPDYSGSGTVQNLTGTYAGVLVPTSDTDQVNTGTTSIGVFAVGIPGLTSGTVISQGVGVLFADGAGYNLSINGTFDPQDSTLTAIIFGESNFLVSESIPNGFENGVETFTTITFSIEAEGSMTGTVKAPTGNDAVTGPGTKNSASITGTAQIDTFTAVDLNGPIITGVINFTVTGFQQSATYSAPTLTPVTFPGS